MSNTLDIQLDRLAPDPQPQGEIKPLVIILLTYARTDYMRATVEAVRRNLTCKYPIMWYVADDGSNAQHLDAVDKALDGANVLGKHSIRQGYGANATHAWYMAHQVADVTLWLEDDWELRRELDVTRYMEILYAHEEIGMIRLAHMVCDMRLTTVNVDGLHFARFEWGQPFAFCGNPALRHRRAREAWGPYPEGLRPGDTEQAYDVQVQQRRGPSIVWPMDIGGWGLFGHIGAVKSYA